MTTDDEVRPETEGDRRRAAQDELLVEALADGMSYAPAGQAAGVVARTVARRMAELEFARQVSQRRGERVAEMTGRLTTLGTEAIAVLQSCLGAERPTDQMRAAQLILTLLVRFRADTELEARLTDLEQKVDSTGEAN